MQKFRLLTGSAAALFVALLLVVSVPVFAESGPGRNGSGSNDATESTSTVSGEQETEVHSTGTAEDSTTTETTHRNRGSVKAAEATTKQSVKANAVTKSGEKKQKVCEAHKKGLNVKFNRIVTNSERTQTRIDEILAKAVAYQKDNNVAAADFDSLVATAETAKTASADSIAALKDVKPTVDCNNTSVASDVATFKTAAQDTRTKLKAYKMSVKAVIKSLLDAKQTTDDSNTTTNNSTTTTTTEGSN